MTHWRHLRSILLLPVTVTILIPALIILSTNSLALFINHGNGTLAPWDPTTKLVVLGVYRHVRNPMISGVMMILAGESLLAGSPPH